MPDFHDPLPAESADPSGAPGLQAAGLAEADDIALGWECANPALQIERWQQEHSGVSDPY